MLFAIVWLGGNIVVTILVGPALAGASPTAHGEVGAQIGARSPRVFRPVAALTILLGIVIGIRQGALTSWASLVSML